MIRVKPYETFDINRTFGRVLLEQDDGREFWLLWLKLPSYQIRRDLYTNRDMWHRLHLFWHGNTGFEFRWLSMPDGLVPVSISERQDCTDCISDGAEAGWNPHSEKWCACERGMRAASDATSSLSTERGSL